MGKIDKKAGRFAARAARALCVGIFGAAIALPVVADATVPWRAAWITSPSNAVQSIPLSANQTIRQIVHVSAAGSILRIRLTQRYGFGAAGLAAVSVGRRAQGADIVPGTLRSVTFAGSRAVTIAAGQSVASDPVDLPVSAFDDLVISFAGSSFTLQTTEHAVAREFPYFSRAANAVDQISGDGFSRPLLSNMNSFFLLEGVDVQAASATRTLVAVGDSVTDGFISSNGSPLLQDSSRNGLNERYPDFLAQRLATRFPGRYSVGNAGISGNRVNAAGATPTFGPALLTRLDQDVLAVPGVTDAILTEGSNDLGLGGAGLAPDADALIAGLTQAVSRLKAANLRVLLGTITPSRGAFAGALGTPGSPFGSLHGTRAVEAARQVVNAWIRSQTIADGVVDFDACLRDPVFPDHLRPTFDSGDHLHPNQLGYAALADCVNLDLLQ